MFFEGSEKKIEVVLTPGSINLRKLGRSYWQKIIEKCNATILSTVSTDKIDAYLLSESSLFVWEDRFLMITCGRTILINSGLEFIKEHGTSAIELFIYQRKNEYLPHKQLTIFEDDISKLKEIFGGESYRFGRLDGHHNYLFHYATKEYQPAPNDITAELLMYHIGGKGAQILRTEHQPKSVIRDLFQLESNLKGFALDDFVFDPFGYSLNAVKDDRYLTIHITPQEDSSYVSFETNIELKTMPQLLSTIVNILDPQTFDTIFYDRSCSHEFSKDYMPVHKAKDNLSSGYEVEFTHYMKRFVGCDSATILD